MFFSKPLETAMEVTREVILDLLPLYLADEASADTRTLVEAYLSRDDDLARLAQQWRQRLPAPPPAALRLDAEAQAFQEAKRLLVAKTIGLAAVAVAFIIGMTAVIGALFYLSSR